MATKASNPFENEKPQLVHLEKDQSHYEYCRMQMHDIEKVHRRSFICNLVICIVVCFLSIFQKYIGGFDMLSTPLGLTNVKAPGAILAGGIFSIVIAMVITLLGYLAWANVHSLNIILECWYVIVTLIGILRLDYLTAIVGVVGAFFYFFSLREMQHEQALSEMEGYPEFQEKFDISKSDIVIQTLLAHQGERRRVSTLFTTDYSLRKKKNQPKYYKNGNSVNDEPTEKEAGAAGAALAEALKERLDAVHEEKQARTAIASLDAVAAAQQREKNGVSLAEMADITSAPYTEAELETESVTVPAAENIEPERADAEAKAAAILAEAEAKAAAILAEAQAKAKEVAAEETSAGQTAAPQQHSGQKQKKKKH